MLNCFAVPSERINTKDRTTYEEDNLMSPQGQLFFASTGHVEIQLIEVLDAVEAPKAKPRGLVLWGRQPVIQEWKRAFLEIGVEDEQQETLITCQTSIKSFIHADCLHFGEDFVFQHVSSTYSVVVSLCFMSINEGVVSKSIAGSARIPLARLEENRQLSQWYQFVSPLTGEGMRSAIRIECVFRAVAKMDGLTPRRLPTVHSEALGDKSSASDREHALAIDVTDNLTNFGNSVDDQDLELTQLSLDAFDTFDANDEVAQVQGKDSAAPRRRRLLTDNDSIFEDLVVDSDADDLLIGIVDYCVVLGSSAPYDSKATHYIAADGLLRRIEESTEQSDAGPMPEADSNAALANDADPVSEFNNDEIPGNSQDQQLEILIWDRYPIEDHADLEFPSKIEWFCCPEGPITVHSDQRPQSFTRPFAFCAGDSEEIYGVSISFFVDVGAVSIEECDLLTSTRGPPSDWWRQESHESSCDEEANSFTSKRAWSAVTVCLLFRTPYFAQLLQCLRYSFSMSIHPQILQWELRRAEHLASFGFSNEQQLLPAHYYDGHKQELLDAFPPCQLLFDSLFTFLCIECPVPVPNLLSVAMQLVAHGDQAVPLNSSRSSNSSARNVTFFPSPNEKVEEDDHFIHFQAHDPECLPTPSFPLQMLLECFGARNVVDILCCLLSESSMLFHTSDLSKLTIICECFRTLLYPLTWNHVYLPLVPVQLLHLVEAPVPFMLGTHTDNVVRIDSVYLSDIVLIDCDLGIVQRHSVSPLTLPEKLDRWLVMALTSLSTPSLLQHDWTSTNPLNGTIQWPIWMSPKMNHTSSGSSNRHALEETRKQSLQIQIVIFDALLQLLRFVPDCLFFLNPTAPVFNRSLFLSDYCDEEHRDMMELLTVTNAFHTLSEMIQSPALVFFRKSIEMLNQQEKLCLVSPAMDPSIAANPASNGAHSHSPNFIGKQLKNAMSWSTTENDDSSVSSGVSKCSSPDSFSPNISNRKSFFRQPSMSTMIFDKIESAASGAANHPIASMSNDSAQGEFSSPSQSLQRTFSFRNKSINLGRQSSFVRQPSEQGGRSGASSQHGQRPLSLIRSTSYIDQGSALSSAWDQSNDLARLLPAWILMTPTISVAKNMKREVPDVGINTFMDCCTFGIQQLLVRRINMYLPTVVPSNAPTLHTSMSESAKLSIQLGETCNFELRFTVPIARWPTDFTIGMIASSVDTEEQKSNKIGDKVCRLMGFGESSLLECQRQSRHWDVRAIASQLHCDTESMLQLFRRTPHTLLHDVNASVGHHDGVDRAENANLLYSHKERRAPVPSTRTVSRNLLSHAMVNHSQFLQRSGAATLNTDSNLHVDEVVSQFLQKIVTMSEEEDPARIAVSLDACVPALAVQTNRTGVIKILKQAKRSHDPKNSKPTTSNVHPLNSKAFEAFNLLFTSMLSLCSQQEDYISAFELLEVAGHYFRILPEQLSRLEEKRLTGQLAIEDEDESELIEFLSEKVCHHPIYQNPVLWQSLMKHRLPHDAFLSNRLKNSKQSKISSKSKFAVSAVLTEVRSLLYMMLGMGLNSARALLVIQSIAQDYQLGIDEYFKLQRFATRLWAQHELHQLQIKTALEDSPIVASGERSSPPKSALSPSNDHIGQSTQFSGDQIAEDASEDVSIKLSLPSRVVRHPETVQATASTTVNSNDGRPVRPSWLSDMAPRPEKKAILSPMTSKEIKRMQSSSPKDPVPSSKVSTRSSVIKKKFFASNHSISGNQFHLPNVDENDSTLFSEHGIDLSTAMDSPFTEERIEGLFAQHHYDKRKQNMSPTIASTAFDVVSNWLMCGTGDGEVHFIDLRSMTISNSMRHGSKQKGNDSYEGVTAIHALSAPCGTENEYVIFTGCSNGQIKSWSLPNMQQSALELASSLSKSTRDSPNTIDDTAAKVSRPNPLIHSKSGKVRIKPTSRQLKAHTGPISCFSSHLFHDGNTLSWIMVSGDRLGGITAIKHDKNSSRSEDKTLLSVALSTQMDSGLASSHDSIQGKGITAISFVNTAEIGLRVTGDPLLAFGTSAGHVNLFDLASEASISSFDAHHGTIGKILALKQNEFLTTGSDRSIKLWDVRMKSRTGVLGSSAASSSANSKHYQMSHKSLGRNEVVRCAAAPITEIVTGGWDNSLVISASADGMVRVWDLRFDLQTAVNTFRAHQGRVSSIVWNGKKEFFSASFDGTVKCWDSINGRNTSLLTVFSTYAPGSLSSTHGSLSGHGTSGSGHHPSSSSRNSVQEGISSMKMTDFTFLQPRAEGMIHAREETVVAKNRSVIVAMGAMGSMKVFSNEKQT